MWNRTMIAALLLTVLSGCSADPSDKKTGMRWLLVPVEDANDPEVLYVLISDSDLKQFNLSEQEVIQAVEQVFDSVEAAIGKLVGETFFGDSDSTGAIAEKAPKVSEPKLADENLRQLFAVGVVVEVRRKTPTGTLPVLRGVIRPDP